MERLRRHARVGHRFARNVTCVATGAVVFNGGADTFAAVRQLTSPIAVKGRIIVAGDNKVYAFRPQ